MTQDNPSTEPAPSNEGSREHPIVPSGPGDHPALTLRRRLDDLFDEVSGWFGDLPSPHWPERLDRYVPRVSFRPMGLAHLDVTETDDEFEISAELPGLDKEDVEVSIKQNTLHIRGEKREEREVEEKEYRVSERRYGAFERAIPLPDSADRDRIQAAFEKGVLKITLPKTEEAKKSVRKIEIA